MTNKEKLKSLLKENNITELQELIKKIGYKLDKYDSCDGKTWFVYIYKEFPITLNEKEYVLKVILIINTDGYVYEGEVDICMNCQPIWEDEITRVNTWLDSLNN